MKENSCKEISDKIKRSRVLVSGDSEEEEEVQEGQEEKQEEKEE